VEETYRVLHGELQEYSETLVQKPSVLALTKKDLWETDFLKKYRDAFDFPVLGISALKNEGLEELKWQLWNLLEKVREEESTTSVSM
jgi:GTPase involved in cell partitioning and DNA repair